MIWQVEISSQDRERAFQALEVATLFSLRRAVRNGSVWIEHSLSFRGRARLFFTDARWQEEAKRHYARLSLPANRSEEHTSELQSLMRISYAVFCLKNKSHQTKQTQQ